jgi:hypothetical protein
VVRSRGATRRSSVSMCLSWAPFYTDARHYAAARIPIVLYGVGEGLADCRTDKSAAFAPLRICPVLHRGAPFCCDDARVIAYQPA